MSSYHPTTLANTEAFAPVVRSPTARVLMSLPDQAMDVRDPPRALPAVEDWRSRESAPEHHGAKALDRHAATHQVLESDTSAIQRFLDVIRLPQNDSWADALRVHESEIPDHMKQVVPAMPSGSISPDIISRIPLRPNIFCTKTFNLNAIDVSIVEHGGKPIIFLLLPGSALKTKTDNNAPEPPNNELAALTCQVQNVTRIVFNN